jgi:hypothetical protein
MAYAETSWRTTRHKRLLCAYAVGEQYRHQVNVYERRRQL